VSKRIAIIGSGISGLVSAYLLNKNYNITLFEANNYIGGHTATIDVNLADKNYAIDTGFIVFNQKTYPNFCRLLQKLQVPIQPTEMSFSFRSDARQIEYNGHNLNTLFADRRNLFKPKFYRMIKDILLFNKQAKKFIAKVDNSDLSIRKFIATEKYSELFVNAYLLPMISAIWSAEPINMLDSPAHFILRFCENHGLLDVANRPQWSVVAGGSKQYIAPLTKSFAQNIRLNTKVNSVRRINNGVEIHTENGIEQFDAVIFATHSDQALNLLADPTDDEKNILAAIPYSNNEVVLHTDESVLPKNKLARASWNYLDVASQKFALTYYMNRLQSLNSKIDFCVSVNLTEHINPEKIIQKFNYSHPCYQVQTIQAQKQHNLINGKNSTYFCGAYWGYGFHEDGVNSAIAACLPLGATF